MSLIEIKDSDDKSQVIVAVFFICLACLIFVGQPALAVVEKALYGLFGIAVGKSIKK